MIKGSRLANSCDGFEANYVLPLMKLSGQKIHKNPIIKYLIRKGIVTSLVTKFRVKIRI